MKKQNKKKNNKEVVVEKKKRASILKSIMAENNLNVTDTFLIIATIVSIFLMIMFLVIGLTGAGLGMIAIVMFCFIGLTNRINGINPYYDDER